MDNRNLQFGVGVLVISTLMIAFLLVMYFGELLAFGQGRYKIHAFRGAWCHGRHTRA